MFEATTIHQSIIRILCPGNVYCYLVKGKEKAMLIDTGCGAYDLKSYIDTLTDLPYQVLLTHGHVDHAGGAGQFDQFYLSPLDLKLVDEHTEIPIRQGYLKQNGEIVTEENMISKKDPASYLSLENDMVFDLGEITIQAIAMPGHSDGFMAFLINPGGICLFGDGCNSLTFLQFENCISLEEYRISIEQFQKQTKNQISEVLYSHPHNYGGIEILDQMIKLCNDIINGDVEGIPFTPNTLLGKPVDPLTYRRLDGKIANIAYLETNIHKK